MILTIATVTDFDRFLADPKIPEIAVRLGVHGPVMKAESVAQFDH